MKCALPLAMLCWAARAAAGLREPSSRVNRFLSRAVVALERAPADVARVACVEVFFAQAVPSVCDSQPTASMRAPAALFPLFLLSAQCNALLGGSLRGAALRSSAPPPGDDRYSDSDRETQSPMVWLRLHKTVLERAMPSWHDVSFAEEAAQRLGEMKAAAQPVL